MADAEKPLEPEKFFSAVDLDGLMIGAAFVKYVIKNPGTRWYALKLRSREPHLSSLFDDGQFPGQDFSFRWPVSEFSELSWHYLRDLFLRSRPAERRKKYGGIPIYMEMPARRIVYLLDRFFDFLRSGEVTAIGTYFESGSEMPVPTKQWARSGLFIDIRSNDLIEEIGGHLTPRWTGMRLSAAITARASEKAVKVGKQDTKRNSSNASKAKCRDWLVTEMGGSPTDRPMPKKQYFNEAKNKFPDLSERSFNWAWSDAIEETNSEWDVAGRPGKSPR